MGFFYNGNDKKFWLYFLEVLLVSVSTLIIYTFLPDEKDTVLPDYQLGKEWLGKTVTAEYNMPLLRPLADIRKDSITVEEEFKPYYILYHSVAYEMTLTLTEAIEKSSHKDDLKNVVAPLCNRLQELYAKGVISDEDYRRERKTAEIRIINSSTMNSVEDVVFISELMTQKSLYEELMKDESVKSHENAIWEIGIKADFFRPNMVRDEKKCDEELKNELSKIPKASGEISAGDKIVGNRQIITAETFQRIKSYEVSLKGKKKDEGQARAKRWGHILLVLLLLSLFTYYLHVYRIHYFTKFRQVMMLYTLIAIFPVLMKIIFRLPYVNIYILPFAIIAILTKVLFESRTAFITYIIAILICALAITYQVEFFATQMVAGLVGIYATKEMSNRGTFVKTAFLVSIATAVTYYLTQVMQTYSWKPEEPVSYLNFVISGLLLLLAYPLLFMFEKTFDITSNVTLIELSDTSKGLLRKLSEVASGTFMHSINVSNLAVEVANKLGANSLLVRTGSLYHDIGKMSNPVYFTENQGGVNPHDNYSEKESASIIINHVIEGRRLAEQNNLPEVIKNFIETHHGHGITKYFFIKYQNNHPDEAVDKTSFMYPGPNPFTLEQAILMMSDSVEAASHSLSEYSEENISKMVNNIIDGQVKDGAFNDCPITFHDIEMAKQVLIEKLKSMYHTRIRYPKSIKEQGTEEA